MLLHRGPVRVALIFVLIVDAYCFDCWCFSSCRYHGNKTLQGFTREFLRGGAGTSGDLLEEIRYAVRDISLGKKVRDSCPISVRVRGESWGERSP